MEKSAYYTEGAWLWRDPPLEGGAIFIGAPNRIISIIIDALLGRNFTVRILAAA